MCKKEIPKGITYLYALKSIVKKSPIGQGEKMRFVESEEDKKE